MRQRALEMLYRSVRDRVSMSRDEFCKAFDGWQVIPLEQGGDLVGTLVERDGEVHVGYGGQPSGSILKHIRGAFGALLKERGALHTKVIESNERGLRFCTRLGFKEMKRDNGVVFMRCERCNYA
jgi:hypothetical protein